MTIGDPPDRWLVLHVRLPPDPLLREGIVELLMDGALTLERPRGVEERDDGLVVHLPAPSGSPDDVVENVRRGLVERGFRSSDIVLGWRLTPHEAWADHWRKDFIARRVSPRIHVAPTWDPVEPAPGEIVVVLDPGMAFGTSEHPTTRGCLRLLDERIRGGERIADVGSGSGILAIAAALLGARDIVAIELDPWAIAAARENVARNGVEERVRFVPRGVTSSFLPGEAPFDGIVANIETPILKPLVSGFAGALSPSGWMILSGILRSEAGEMTALARASGFALEAEDGEGEWWSATFSRVGASG